MIKIFDPVKAVGGSVALSSKTFGSIKTILLKKSARVIHLILFF